MSQIERGGQNVQRWPAELPETDNPEGTVGEEAREGKELDEERERLAELPAHEQDPDDALGGGILSSGGTAVERGDPGTQPVPSEEGERTDEGGLPLSEPAEDR